MKIGKYEFKDKETAEAKIKGLGTSIDENGNEIPVPFTGLVGKSFRPPELYNMKGTYIQNTKFSK